MHSESPSTKPTRPQSAQSGSSGDSAQSLSGSSAQSQNSAQSHSFQSFGDYSEFLRSAVADEESLQVGETLQALAVQIEAVVAMLQERSGELPEQSLALALINLVGDLRAHRAQLLGLGADWHRFYEFDAHFVALNHFRILVTQWAMEAAPPRCMVPIQADFDLAAWRVLGAGSLLLDVYEQSRKSVAQPATEQKAQSVWGRWSAWWSRRQARSSSQRQQGRRGRRKTD